MNKKGELNMGCGNCVRPSVKIYGIIIMIILVGILGKDFLANAEVGEAIDIAVQNRQDIALNAAAIANLASLYEQDRDNSRQDTQAIIAAIDRIKQ